MKTKAVSKTEHPLHVVHIAAEFAPIAKVGGLADVVTGTYWNLSVMAHRPFLEHLKEARCSAGSLYRLACPLSLLIVNSISDIYGCVL